MPGGRPAPQHGNTPDALHTQNNDVEVTGTFPARAGEGKALGRRATEPPVRPAPGCLGPPLQPAAGTARGVPASEPGGGHAAAAPRRAESGAEIPHGAWPAPRALTRGVQRGRGVTAGVMREVNHRQHLKRRAPAHHSHSQFPPPRPSARYLLFALRQYLRARARNRDAIILRAVERAETPFSPVHRGRERAERPVPRKPCATASAARPSCCSQPVFIT